MASDVCRNGASERTEPNFVDADDLTVEIHEWSAAIAKVDHGIMANPANQIAHPFTILLQPSRIFWRYHFHVGNDSHRHRLGHACWTAHREDFIANFDIINVSELSDRQRLEPFGDLVHVKFDDAKIGLRIRSNQFCIDSCFVSQTAPDS